MLRSKTLSVLLGLLVGFAVQAAASADSGSIQSDCEEGDWSVTVTLDGLGAFDVSCLDGTKVVRSIDTGALVVTAAAIEATSALGTHCAVPTTGERKIVFECASKSEDSAGLEVEDELEVEIEWEKMETDEDGEGDGTDDD